MVWRVSARDRGGRPALPHTYLAPAVGTRQTDGPDATRSRRVRAVGHSDGAGGSDHGAQGASTAQVVSSVKVAGLSQACPPPGVASHTSESMWRR